MDRFLACAAIESPIQMPDVHKATFGVGKCTWIGLGVVPVDLASYSGNASDVAFLYYSRGGFYAHRSS